MHHAAAEFSIGDPSLAIDFANTIRRRGMVDVDLLSSGEQLASWSETQDGRVPRVLPGAAERRLREARTVRDDVHAVLHATVAGAALPPRAVARLNARARETPIVAQLGRRPGELRRVAARRLGALDELLARVAEDAIALVAGRGAGAVHFCDAPSCGGFYTPTRPNQVWCDASCGTRARVARHAAHARG